MNFLRLDPFNDSYPSWVMVLSWGNAHVELEIIHSWVDPDFLQTYARMLSLFRHDKLPFAVSSVIMTSHTQLCSLFVTRYKIWYGISEDLYCQELLLFMLRSSLWSFTDVFFIKWWRMSFFKTSYLKRPISSIMAFYTFTMTPWQSIYEFK